MKPMVSAAKSIHEQLEELSAFNADPHAGGITREVFTAEYMAAHEYVAEVMADVGLRTRTDTFGNLFGRLDGSEPSAARVLTGSHIDTTLNAGRYDGVLGVLGGVEAVRTLLADGVRPRRTIEVVCFAGEEPRFGPGCIGSRVLTGQLSRADLDSIHDRDGTTIAQALVGCGLEPDRVAEARLDPAEIHAFVELHIEQGGVLEQAEIPIGVVTHIAAPHDLFVVLSGEAAHSGATPMPLRRDALAGAAAVMVALERIARESSSGTSVATVGVLRALPGAINVVPGRVELEVDIRDRDLTARTDLVERFIAEVEMIATQRNLTAEVSTLNRDEPAVCDPIVVEAVRAASEQLDIPHMDIVSGAYHDAMVLGAEVPMGMIFVPSVGGISHSPDEFTASEDLERGIAVLADTLAELAEAV